MDKTVGDKICELLQIRGMTKAELSRISGISTGLLSDICSNKRTSIMLDTAQRIAKALGIHPAFFFEEDTVGPADLLSHMTDDQKEFVLTTNALPWIKLSKEASEKGISPDKIKKIIDIVMEDYADVE